MVTIRNSPFGLIIKYHIYTKQLFEKKTLTCNFD